MSEALYIKYRPSSFKEVVGQELVVKSLRNVLKTGSNRTFLFHGPSGTGKTTLARIAAQVVGCDSSELREYDAATNTGIDSMRVITEGLSYKPFSNSKRVIIIDEAQAISKAGFQSLLKSLEEPPEWVYWFLCTTDPVKIPNNIKTRCTSYELKPVSSSVMQDWLLEICQKEGLDVPGPIVDLCSKQAGGSPRQALVNLGMCQSLKDRSQAAQLLKTSLESDDIIELARALVSGKSWAIVQPLLAGLSEANVESSRQVVRAYITKVILTSNNQKLVGNCLEILDAFSEPFHPQDGVSPLVLACGKLCLEYV